ncbi:MAG: hypothetical protein RL235_148 [Chlamydiota bacterium]|jgi:hypothetical protein
MLEFFRKHQRFFFLFVTCIVVFSFVFFGTFSALYDTQMPEDPILGQTAGGSSIHASEMRNMIQYIARSASAPNMCDDGVVEKEFLASSLGKELVSAYFDDVRPGLEERHKRLASYRPYVHTEDAQVSMHALWSELSPELEPTLMALRTMDDDSPATFEVMAKLYLCERKCPPGWVREWLRFMADRNPDLRKDPRLLTTDVALGGFHSLADWFGPEFLGLVAKCIFNGAESAEQMGLRVSNAEAKADLYRQFHEATRSLKGTPFSLRDHVRSIGLDEKSAIETWRKITLFRRFLNHVGDATLVDRLVGKEIEQFAAEKAKIDLYTWPDAMVVTSAKDFALLRLYTEALFEDHKLYQVPGRLRGIDEVEKKTAELVQSTFRVDLAVLSREELLQRVPLGEVLGWQMSDEGWSRLCLEIPGLNLTEQGERRVQVVQGLPSSDKARADRLARGAWVDGHPDWVLLHLKGQTPKERTVHVSKMGVSWNDIADGKKLAGLLEKASNGDEGAKEELVHFGNGPYLSISRVERLEPKKILSLQEVKERNVFAKALEKRMQEKLPDGYLAELTAKARVSIVEMGERSPWLVTEETDPLVRQFLMTRQETDVCRSDMLRDAPFSIAEQSWSEPIEIAADGFMFFKVVKREAADGSGSAKAVGRALVREDAKRHMAHMLIEHMKGEKQ